MLRFMGSHRVGHNWMTELNWYVICLSLSDLVHIVWESLGPSMSPRWHDFTLSYGWVVFHCTYVSSVQSLSHVQLFATPWIAARQASLSITNSRSSLRLTSIESVMPSSHLIISGPQIIAQLVFFGNDLQASSSATMLTCTRGINLLSYGQDLLDIRKIKLPVV